MDLIDTKPLMIEIKCKKKTIQTKSMQKKEVKNAGGK